MALHTTVKDLGKSFEKLKATMNNAQMDKAIELMNQLVSRDAELLDLLGKMKPEDQREFLPRVLQSLTNTELCIKDLERLKTACHE